MSGLTAVFLSMSLAVTAGQAPAPGVGAIDTVRQLYASADYESALAALDGLGTPEAPATAAEADRYRALCLMALGRTTDAEVAIERIVRANPSYQPDEQEPPRVRAAFASVRARVLPDVARALYADARAAYDRKEYPQAVAGFERTVAVLDSVESADPTLRDLRTLASGFLDLGRAAATPPPAPPPQPEPAAAAPPPAPAVESASPSESSTPPIVVEQVLPPWNPAWYGSQFQLEFRGAVEVAIDDTGRVTSARITQSIHPYYDQQLLQATRGWRYQPATRNGKPVTSTKRVDVVVRTRN